MASCFTHEFERELKFFQLTRYSTSLLVDILFPRIASTSYSSSLVLFSVVVIILLKISYSVSLPWSVFLVRKSFISLLSLLLSWWLLLSMLSSGCDGVGGKCCLKLARFAIKYVSNFKHWKKNYNNNNSWIIIIIK